MAMKTARQSDTERERAGGGGGVETYTESDWQPDEDVNVAASSIGTFDF